VRLRVFLQTLLCIVTLVAATVGPSLRAQSSTSPVAFIEKIGGDVTLITRSDQLKLRPGIDDGRILYSDETLVCGTAGHALLRTSADLHQAHDVCKGAKMWPPQPGPKTSAPIATNRLVKALESYGVRGGGDRAIGDSAIYSPPKLGGAILPQSLVVRWLTRPPLGIFTAILFDPNGKELARAAAVDGASGILDSQQLRDALTAYQNAHDSAEEMMLVFRFESEPEQFVRFHVLTAAQRQELENALGSLDSAEGLFYRIERAAVYTSFHMYDLVAAEYEAALVEAPESRDLLSAAFNANLRTGNKRRAHELSDKLAEVEERAKR